MKTEPLTKQEAIWLHKLEKILMNPPSQRIGFYTIGDAYLSAYDRSREIDINNALDQIGNSDFCHAVDKLDAGLGEVSSACQIFSTAG